MINSHSYNGDLVSSALVLKTKTYAESILRHLPEKFSYHNLKHTHDVVDAALEIGARCKLEEKDMEIVLMAAYLHDIGYSKSNQEHERHSMALSQDFLTKEQVPARIIEQVTQCIEATKMPQNPKNKREQVLCDADLYHLADKSYLEKSELLRKEFSIIEEDHISQMEWLDMSSVFIENHSYFTDYGRQELEPKKEKNLKKIRQKLKKSQTDPGYLIKVEKELEKLREEKDKKPSRGIETMFRITSKNHLTLSGMADTKANIMISINSIILSILVSVLIRKFGEYPNLILPTLILVGVSLAAIVFSVLATRPNVSSGTFTQDDILNKRTNLLFFGNFHGMRMQDYLWGMKEMMKDGDYLYGSMIKDIYFLGKVLGKKYRMLRISYTIFMFGFVIAIITFLLAVVFKDAFNIFQIDPSTF